MSRRKKATDVVKASRHFEFSRGAVIRADPEVVNEELLRISDKNDGALTPPVVVEEAEPESSPLHHLFEWDNTKAGHQYRIVQARYLIRCIKVIHHDEKRLPLRLWVNVSRHTDESRYMPVEKVMQKVETREEVLLRALQEMISWRRRWQHLREFSRLFESIDRFTDEFQEQVGKTEGVLA